MERSFIRISVENLVTVALLSAFAYLGVMGMTLTIQAIKTRVPALNKAATGN